MAFPEDFLWGTASGAYQCEGAAFEDGKGRCIWDDFAHTPGKIHNGETGDVACDAYHRAAEDIELLSSLGMQAYRFSIHWTRIFPDGTGRMNPKGFDYYDQLVDGLLKRGIEPYVTLHHWDLPSALQAQGGWLNRKTADAFAAFAECCGKHFAGRVKNWFTINEPQCIVSLGLAQGIHAPGLCLSTEELLLATHHLLLAHGMGVQALRASCPSGIAVGPCSTGRVCYPSKDTPKEKAAAYAETFRTREDDWQFFHAWFLDAAILGHYPTDATGPLKQFAESVSQKDMETICQPVDFVGLNLYNGHEVDASGNYLDRHTGYPRTALRWPVTERALRYGAMFLWERYGLPIHIAENGQSCNDRIFLDGKVHDPDRIDFLTRYLRELSLAIDEGVPIKSYFHWSFMDNLEWHSGYDDRFGLVYVDYRNLKRIPKDSARWYTRVIRSNGRVLYELD